MDKTHDRTWHIYALIDPRDEQIRYVGLTHCGIRRRFNEHMKQVRDGEATYKANWIRSLFELSLKPKITELESGVGPGAQDAEIKWIASLSESGAALTNLTVGGDGAVGHIHSDEHKKWMSQNQSKRMESQELRDRVRSCSAAMWENDEYRKFMSESTKAKWARDRESMIQSIRKAKGSAQARKNASEATKRSYENNQELRALRGVQSKKRWDNPELRVRMIEAISKRQNSQESKAKMSEASRQRWNDPDKRASMIEAIKKSRSSPESRERTSVAVKESLLDPQVQKKRSEYQLKSWENKEIRDRRSRAFKASWEDPEKRAKRSAGMKKAWERRRQKIASGEILTQRDSNGRYAKLVSY